MPTDPLLIGLAGAAIGATLGAAIAHKLTATPSPTDIEHRTDPTFPEGGAETEPETETETDPDPSFAEVCLVVAQVKADRDAEATQANDRAFADGADAVLGKLMERGHDADIEKLRLSYLAAGEDIPFIPDRMTPADLERLSETLTVDDAVDEAEGQEGDA